MKIIMMAIKSYISDYFVCQSCGFGMYFKVIGDTCTCPECGGKMKRT